MWIAILIILMIVAALYATKFVKDETIWWMRLVGIGLAILCFWGYNNENKLGGSHSNFWLVYAAGFFILIAFGIFSENKCGFIKKQSCPKCGRKDSWETTETGRDVLDRVYKGNDKEGKAVYHEVADIYVHGLCKNCGFENDFVERKSYNTTY